jgi:hypothetical protein
MLKIVEYGLLAVSLLIVLALILASPRATAPIPAAEPDTQPKLPPAVNS